MTSRIEIDLAGPVPQNFRSPLAISMPAGQELHRIHHTAYGPCQFNGADRGNARFSPIRDRSGAIIPTIYAAQSFRCAACEIILRAPDAVPDPAVMTIVSPRDFDLHQHSTIRTRRALELVDLTPFGQRAVGLVGNALLSGGTLHYQATRDWVEAVHAHVPWAQGICYTSFQAGPDFAIVLFGDRCGDVLEETSLPRPVRSAPVADEIRIIAEMIGIEYTDI